jgi:hypothetical protein
MKRTLLACVTGLLVIIGTGCSQKSHATPPDPPPVETRSRLDLETERVVVFKDGYGLFVKTAVGRADDNGHVYTDEVPDAAVLGAFWALAEDGQPVLEMTAGWVESIERRKSASTCTTIRELLRVNAGKPVTLELNDGRRVQGTLAGVLELAPPGIEAPEMPPGGTGIASPARRSTVLHHLDSPAQFASQPRQTSRQIEPRGGDLVVIDSPGGGRTALPVAAVRAVSGPDLTTRIERVTETKRRSKRLIFDLGKPEAHRLVTLRILYFAPGIRWIPTYRMGGDFDDAASLALQGEILNEVEDIDDAALDLVVGVPNFRFKEVVSPFVLEATLLHTLRSAAPDLMGQRMSNTFTQRSSEWRAPSQPTPSAGGSATIPSQIGGDRNQDLFVYGQRGVTIKKGARTAVALWQRTFPLSHVYTMETHLVRNARTGATRRRQPHTSTSVDSSPLRLSSDRVWHQLELVNDGDAPWTTGPVLILQQWLPLGQELLTYTSPGGRTRVPVTVAIDVRGSHVEREVERQFGAMKLNGHTYTLVRKEGKVLVTNHKNEPIDFEAAVSFGGTADTASNDGQIIVDDLHPDDWDEGANLLNNHSRVSWQLRLEPGETKTLTYSCGYYVR